MSSAGVTSRATFQFTLHACTLRSVLLRMQQACYTHIRVSPTGSAALAGALCLILELHTTAYDFPLRSQRRKRLGSCDQKKRSASGEFIRVGEESYNPLVYRCGTMNFVTHQLFSPEYWRLRLWNPIHRSSWQRRSFSRVSRFVLFLFPCFLFSDALYPSHAPCVAFFCCPGSFPVPSSIF